MFHFSKGSNFLIDLFFFFALFQFFLCWLSLVLLSLLLSPGWWNVCGIHLAHNKNTSFIIHNDFFFHFFSPFHFFCVPFSDSEKYRNWDEDEHKRFQSTAVLYYKTFIRLCISLSKYFAPDPFVRIEIHIYSIFVFRRVHKTALSSFVCLVCVCTVNALYLKANSNHHTINMNKIWNLLIKFFSVISTNRFNRHKIHI